jgi:hypothetical protein
VCARVHACLCVCECVPVLCACVYVGGGLFEVDLVRYVFTIKRTEKTEQFSMEVNLLNGDDDGDWDENA